MQAGFLFLHTRMSLMAKQEYEPTPDEIRAACAIIRAERMEMMRERPVVKKAASQDRRCRVVKSEDEGLIV